MPAAYRKKFKHTLDRLIRKATLCLTFMAAVGSAPVARADKTPAPADTTTTETCASNSNLAELSQQVPQIFQALDLMEKLPLTGKNIYDVLTDPANGIRSCLSSALEKQKIRGAYIQKSLKVQKNVGTSVTFHEGFHAAQDVNGSNAGVTTMCVKDAAFGCLLQEATAVAYELAARQEAGNNGLNFALPDSSLPSLPSGRLENMRAFSTAYSRAWRENAEADFDTRDAKALEAGGKAVVRRLLNGDDNGWRIFYAQLTTENVNTFVSSQNTRNVKQRRDIYAKLGAVSAQINFTPEEYLGPQAEKFMDACLKSMNIIVRTPVPLWSAQQPAPSTSGMNRPPRENNPDSRHQRHP